MKIIPIVFLFFLISSFAQAQINYSHFKQTWCKCLPDSGTIATDTLTFRIESEACKVNTYSKTHIHLQQLEYTFKKKNKVEIYESAGSMLRKDYVGELHIEVNYKTNSEGDTIQIDSTYSTIGYRAGSSNATFVYSTYQLKRSKNRLIIFKEKGRPFQYEILFLSSTMLLMRKID